MSEQFKPGDLVMVVKPAPCCGGSESLGKFFTVDSGHVVAHRCLSCGATTIGGENLVALEGERCAEPYRLKKIDPPATGDSLPTRAEREQKA